MPNQSHQSVTRFAIHGAAFPFPGTAITRVTHTRLSSYEDRIAPLVCPGCAFFFGGTKVFFGIQKNVLDILGGQTRQGWSTVNDPKAAAQTNRSSNINGKHKQQENQHKRQEPHKQKQVAQTTKSTNMKNKQKQHTHEKQQHKQQQSSTNNSKSSAPRGTQSVKAAQATAKAAQTEQTATKTAKVATETQGPRRRGPKGLFVFSLSFSRRVSVFPGFLRYR